MRLPLVRLTVCLSANKGSAYCHHEIDFSIKENNFEFPSCVDFHKLWNITKSTTDVFPPFAWANLLWHVTTASASPTCMHNEEKWRGNGRNFVSWVVRCLRLGSVCGAGRYVNSEGGGQIWWGEGSFSLGEGTSVQTPLYRMTMRDNIPATGTVGPRGNSAYFVYGYYVLG